MTEPLNQDALRESYGRHINPAYPAFLGQLGLGGVAREAAGDTITDADGRTFVDCVGGYGLFNIGHNHPVVAAALSRQLDRGQLFTRPLITEESVLLAKTLERIAPGDLSCSFLANSGSEAIDTAIKLARMTTGRKKIVTIERSFHGYTFGALSVSGIPSFRRIFEPLLPEVVHVPFGDAEALEAAADDGTAAVLLELVQHEAGIRVLAREYVSRAREICERRGILLVVDEIKTGCGRTGRMLACEHYDLEPDVLVLGKSLGGGFIPVGAVIASPRLWKRFGMSFPMSASSFAWNTLASVAAKATIEVLENEGLIDAGREKGDALLARLRDIAASHGGKLTGVEGRGLLIGIGTDGRSTTWALARGLIERGVLAMPAYGDVKTLMIEPPLVITEEHLDQVVSAVDATCGTQGRP